LLPTIIAISLAVVFVIVLLLFIGMYNKLVRMKVECDGAWAQIDVQLKRRYDLIPNLKRSRGTPRTRARRSRP
jgi:LemA protein